MLSGPYWSTNFWVIWCGWLLRGSLLSLYVCTCICVFHFITTFLKGGCYVFDKLHTRFQNSVLPLLSLRYENEKFKTRTIFYISLISWFTRVDTFSFYCVNWFFTHTLDEIVVKICIENFIIDLYPKSTVWPLSTRNYIIGLQTDKGLLGIWRSHPKIKEETLSTTIYRQGLGF